MVNTTGLHDERERVTWLMNGAVVLVFVSALVALGTWVHLLVVRRLVRFSELADFRQACAKGEGERPASPREARAVQDAAVAAAPAVVIGSGIRGSKLALPGELAARLPGVEVIEGLAR